MSRTSFRVPVHDDPTRLADPDVTPVGHREVPARNAGVRGLVVTRRSFKSGVSDDEWVLTQRASGRSVGSYSFPTIASARRAAKAIESLADWGDPDLIRHLTQPQIKRIAKAMSEEQSEAWGVGVWVDA